MSTAIAMWSGPRNISTAMMRSWGNRADTFVCDEPLYAHYLLSTRRTDHPGYEQTVAAHETDWRKVVDWLTGPVPNGAAVFYQKHMAHHLLAEMATDWIDALENVLLIRDPGEMLTSLIEFLPAPTLDDTGLPQQVKLFDRLTEKRGQPPPVIDARDVLDDPPVMLRALCARLDVPFDEAMLHWAPGPRQTDGAWAPYWYDKVYQTTSFGKYRPKRAKVPASLQPLLHECEDLYQKLHTHRITTADLSPAPKLE